MRLRYTHWFIFLTDQMMLPDKNLPYDGKIKYRNIWKVRPTGIVDHM